MLSFAVNIICLLILGWLKEGKV